MEVWLPDRNKAVNLQNEDVTIDINPKKKRNKLSKTDFPLFVLFTNKGLNQDPNHAEGKR